MRRTAASRSADHDEAVGRRAEGCRTRAATGRTCTTEGTTEVRRRTGLRAGRVGVGRRAGRATAGMLRGAVITAVGAWIAGAASTGRLTGGHPLAADEVPGRTSSHTAAARTVTFAAPTTTGVGRGGMYRGLDGWNMGCLRGQGSAGTGCDGFPRSCR